jgi:hypothetical protein
VPGATVDRFSRRVPVVVENLPAGFELESVDPPEVEVTFEGPRRSFLLPRVDATAELHVDALLGAPSRSIPATCATPKAGG